MGAFMNGTEAEEASLWIARAVGVWDIAAGTVVNMAQTFVGSNNINTLFPSGQFGTRLQGGKDAASPRYIFTRLAEVARLLFHPDDDALLR